MMTKTIIYIDLTLGLKYNTLKVLEVVLSPEFLLMLHFLHFLEIQVLRIPVADSKVVQSVVYFPYPIKYILSLVFLKTSLHKLS